MQDIRTTQTPMFHNSTNPVGVHPSMLDAGMHLATGPLPQRPIPRQSFEETTAIKKTPPCALTVQKEREKLHECYKYLYEMTGTDNIPLAVIKSLNKAAVDILRGVE